MKNKAKKLLSFIVIACLATGNVLPVSAVQVSDAVVTEAGISANEQQALEDAKKVEAIVGNERGYTECVDYYAGKYINDEGNLVVLVTDEATEEQITEILSVVSTNVVVEVVTHSYNELKTAFETASSKMLELSAKVKAGDGTKAEVALYNNIVSVSLGVQQNATVVGMKEVTEETKTAFIEFFGDENVIFEQSDGAVTDNNVISDDIDYDAVLKIKLNKKKLNLKKKETFKLKVKNTSNKMITWKSSKPKVAKVNKNGKVTALKKGKAKITAKIKGVKKKLVCKVTVKNK